MNNSNNINAVIAICVLLAVLAIPRKGVASYYEPSQNTYIKASSNNKYIIVMFAEQIDTREYNKKKTYRLNESYKSSVEYYKNKKLLLPKKLKSKHEARLAHEAQLNLIRKKYNYISGIYHNNGSTVPLKEIRSYMHENDVYIFNDGIHYVGKQGWEAFSLYNKSGLVRMFRLEDIIPHSRNITEAMIASSASPPLHEFSWKDQFNINDEKLQVFLITVGRYSFTIDVTNGEIVKSEYNWKYIFSLMGILDVIFDPLSFLIFCFIFFVIPFYTYKIFISKYLKS